MTAQMRLHAEDWRKDNSIGGQLAITIVCLNEFCVLGTARDVLASAECQSEWFPWIHYGSGGSRG